jgi:hypothetical protein
MKEEEEEEEDLYFCHTSIRINCPGLLGGVLI